MGARLEPLPDGLVVHGGLLHGAAVDSGGDHRMAMALAVAGLAASGETVVHGWEAVETSYPGFERDMESLCGS
jgi:3-phosphoshikimate 1-carboxyvinyltransferase